MKSKWYEGLTGKQRLFCEEFASNGGNATAAGRKAGYRIPEQSGNENLRKPKILNALKLLSAEPTKLRIATREQRQKFWSDVMEDSGEEMKARLRASELLGKSQADFVERHEHSGLDGGPIQAIISDRPLNIDDWQKEHGGS